jgi:thiol-disulfide isomerase/thioredoxin
MNTKRDSDLPLLTGCLAVNVPLPALEKPRHCALPEEDPAKAWAEVQKLQEALRAPDDWQAHEPKLEQVSEFQNKAYETALSLADKAREFIERFPTDDNIGDARITVVHALTHAIATGDIDAETQISAFVSAVLADKCIPEDDRVGVLLYSGNAVFMKRVGMRLFTEGMRKLHEEFETAAVESLRAAVKQFPTNSMIYTLLVAVAQRSEGKREEQLATEILNSPGAPLGAKSLASHILKGTKPYQVGKPLDIRFTALDGRAADLSKLSGKVVLVEFWSTTCGPCVAEMPRVKAAYEKLHPRGFEAVGISLDDEETALRRFIDDAELPWPQHFDGKGWENRFAVQYGIFSIPTMWLVDKRGNLRDTNARFDLERQINSLLDEQIS